MNPILGAAIDVQRFCDSQGWRFCFIGPLLDLKGTPEDLERLNRLLSNR